MAVIECSPYFNEALLLSLKLREAERWIDCLSVSEADYTFKGEPKGFVLSQSHNILRRVQVSGQEEFHSRLFGLKRRFPFLGWKTAAWRNEEIQRNAACAGLEIGDSDVIILSDIDEIIDHRYAAELLELTQKMGIITVKLHFTMFYVNLFSQNWHAVWPGSPPDYSYRVFLMTGKFFKENRVNSNRIRRLGEGGKLVNEVHCYDSFVGFHYSWLGGHEAAIRKFHAYAHAAADHGSAFKEAESEGFLEQYISERIKRGESVFEGHKLVRIPIERAPLLPAVTERLDGLANLVLQ